MLYLFIYLNHVSTHLLLERNKIWIAPLPLDLIHKARNDLNSMMTPITQDVLKKYDIISLASIIRLYLLELPDCLVTYELYEPIKLLYANSKLIYVLQRENKNNDHIIYIYTYIYSIF